VLQALLAEGVAGTFNAITVDGDTSTNDSVLLFATGAAAARGAPRITASGDRRLDAFSRALSEILGELALQIVRDAEGNNKVVTIVVRGAQSAPSAKRVALAIAGSLRVKISLGSGKPNLGRIVMAVGKAGEPVDPMRLGISFGDVVVASGGEVVPALPEAALAAYMAGRDILVDVDLGVGSARATVWTSALTPKYLEINSV
jgi:glutamate N-acetyltransferase/amino-acid N-acetyltransferase